MQDIRQIRKTLKQLRIGFLMGCLGMVASVSSYAGLVVADLEDVTNPTSFFAKLIIEDIAGGVKVTADISDPINTGLTNGDILGIGFHIADESLLGSLSVTNNGNEDPLGIITSTCFGANSCELFTGGSGQPGRNMDIVIGLGIVGAAAGFVQTVMLEMLSSSFLFSAMLFANEKVGMRVQSIQYGDTRMDGSSKLIGDGPGEEVPSPGSLALLAIGLLGWRALSGWSGLTTRKVAF